MLNFYLSANLALALGVLVHILSFIIPNSFINRTMDGYADIPFTYKIVMGLVPNINLIFGMKV